MKPGRSNTVLSAGFTNGAELTVRRTRCTGWALAAALAVAEAAAAEAADEAVDVEDAGGRLSESLSLP
jgi:hypothetical protein